MFYCEYTHEQQNWTANGFEPGSEVSASERTTGVRIRAVPLSTAAVASGFPGTRRSFSSERTAGTSGVPVLELIILPITVRYIMFGRH